MQAGGGAVPCVQTGAAQGETGRAAERGGRGGREGGGAFAAVGCLGAFACVFGGVLFRDGGRL